MMATCSSDKSIKVWDLSIYIDSIDPNNYQKMSSIEVDAPVKQKAPTSEYDVIVQSLQLEKEHLKKEINEWRKRYEEL